MKSKGLSVNVSVKDTDVFNDIISILKDVIEDTRIPVEVKQEVKEKLQRIVVTNSYEIGA